MHTEVLVGLGAVVLLAGLVARLGRRFGLPTIPCYMVIGMLAGPGTPGPVLVEHPEDLEMLAVLGLVLLLFHLGVEFPTEQVLDSGRRLFLAAGFYIALNLAAGFAVGMLLGWGVAEALVIAGAMGISSSAIATKLLIEMRRLTNAETPVVLGIIVIEDLFLALYLAVLAPVLAETGSPLEFIGGIVISFLFLAVLFTVARFGARAVAWLIGSRTDELLAVLVIGLVLLVAGLSERLGVSDAIGALMIGLVVGRTRLRERVERAVVPMRDLFAAVFFVAFGLNVDIGELGGVALPALLAVLVTTACNIVGGVVAARLFGLNQRAAANIAFTVLGRGEFSLILVTMALAAGLNPRIQPFVALYVLVLAVAAPLLAAQSRYLARFLPDGVLRTRWRYVREESISTACTHLDQIRVTETDLRECPRCVAEGGSWVQLRMCLSCGQVGCCDDSPARHASGHASAAQHPLIESLEPGEDWRYCYFDQTLVSPPTGQSRPPAAEQARA